MHSSVRGQVARGMSITGMIASYLLLHAPCDHFRELEKLWVDGRVMKKCWVEFANSLNAEWTTAVTHVR